MLVIIDFLEKLLYNVSEKYFAKGCCYIMKETLKIYKREAFAFGFSFFMLFIAYICKYVLYLEHIVSTVFSLLSLTGIIILTALIIWRLLIENKLLMLVTIVILFSMAIFNSTQTNAVIFPLIFELIRKCITYKSPLDTMSLENKIKRFNNEKNTVKATPAQSPPDGFALNLRTYFPSSCTEIP